RFRRGIAVGSGCAAVLLAALCAITRSDLAGRSEELRRAKARIAEAQSVIGLRDQTAAERGAVVQANARARSRMSEAPQWDAAMIMLAASTPKNIKLTDIQFVVDSGRAVAKLSGRTALKQGADAQSALKGYMDAL